MQTVTPPKRWQKSLLLTTHKTDKKRDLQFASLFFCACLQCDKGKILLAQGGRLCAAFIIRKQEKITAPEKVVSEGKRGLLCDT